MGRCKYRILSRDGDGAVTGRASRFLAAKAFERFFPEHQLRYRRGSEWRQVFSKQRLAAGGAPRLAELLGEKLRALGVRCWLVNTGWVGGAYGVGERISLRYTRALLQALLSGELETVATRREPVLGLRTPVECPGVPAEILDARGMWPDAAAYDEAAANLRQRFEANYRKFE